MVTRKLGWKETLRVWVLAWALILLCDVCMEHHFLVNHARMGIDTKKERNAKPYGPLRNFRYSLRTRQVHVTASLASRATANFDFLREFLQ